MVYKIDLSGAAQRDLEEIVEFISRDKPEIGERVGREIVKHLRMLEKFPRLGRVVPEFGEENLREIIHTPYRLIYEIDDEAHRIVVVRVWHGARSEPEISTED
jgi:toxin ParE1/3/4